MLPEQKRGFAYVKCDTAWEELILVYRFKKKHLKTTVLNSFKLFIY